MRKEKHVIVIDHDDPLSFYKPGSSQRLTFAERMSVYRLLLFRKGFACPRYRGIRGILRLSVQFFKNESKSLFRRSQQQDISKERTSPEFERWARAMEFTFVNGTPWPWNCYLWKGREERKLPLRMYPKELYIYIRHELCRAFRSVRNSLSAWLLSLRCLGCNSSNNRNSRTGEPSGKGDNWNQE